MPPEVRELLRKPRKAAFEERGGKGSHKNFVHPKASKPVAISGKLGDDARKYRIRAVEKAVQEADK